MDTKLAAGFVLATTAAAGVAFATLTTAQGVTDTLTTAQGITDTTAEADAAIAAPTEKEIKIYRDPSCGCCDAYADYLTQNGYDVTLVDDTDFVSRSIAAGVPEQGLGCHLATIEGYAVSGLVPVEVLERLVEERPDITGITLPGMPVNAPGMAFTKTGTLKVYAFDEGGVSLYSNE